MFHQPSLVELRALHQLGVGERHADAAAKIARDVDQRRSLAGFLRRQTGIGDRIDRDEHERHADGLEDADRGEVTEARIGRQRRRRPHRQRNDRKSDRHPVFRLHARDDLPGERHHQQHGEPARHHGEAGQHRRVGKVRLHQLRRDLVGAEQHRAHRQHGDERHAELALEQQPQIDHWILMGQFPRNKEQQRAAGNQRANDDEARSPPVVDLTAVEHEFERTEDERNQHNSDPVDLEPARQPLAALAARALPVRPPANGRETAKECRTAR